MCQRRQSAASRGAASTMATLIACAPWEPPKIRTLARRRASGRDVRRPRSKNSGRTGLPATNPSCRRTTRVESNVTAAALHDARQHAGW